MPNPQPPETPTAIDGHSPGVHRRTVITTAAWATPVIAASVALPAYAASETTPRLLTLSAISAPLSVVRCSSLAAGSAKFQVLADGIPASVREPVTLTVPTGLRFTGTSQSGENTRVVLTDGTGVINVPEIQAIGSAGTYSITARLADAISTITVDLTPSGVGSAYLVGYGSTSSPGAVNLAGVVSSSVSNSGYAFVTDSGDLYVSGVAMGVAATTPRKIASNMAKVDLRIVHNKAYFIYIAAVDRDGNVWSGTAKNNVPTLKRLTGSTGTIIDFKVIENALFVHTTEAIFYNGAAVGNPTDRMNMLSESAGATYMSLSDQFTDTLTATGMFINPQGHVMLISALNNTPSTKFNGRAPGPVRAISVSSGGVALLTHDGRLWVSGGNWGTSSEFKQLGTGTYSQLSGWTRYSASIYHGITLLGADGAVYQAMGNAAQSPGGTVSGPIKVQGLDGKTVTRVFGNDGLSQVLTSDGTVWAWSGNLAESPATQVVIPNRVDEYTAYSWRDSSYSGWGIALTQDSCPVL